LFKLLDCFFLKRDHDPNVYFEIGKHNLAETEVGQEQRKAADIIVVLFFSKIIC